MPKLSDTQLVILSAVRAIPSGKGKLHFIEIGRDE